MGWNGYQQAVTRSRPVTRYRTAYRTAYRTVNDTEYYDDYDTKTTYVQEMRTVTEEIKTPYKVIEPVAHERQIGERQVKKTKKSRQAGRMHLYAPCALSLRLYSPMLLPLYIGLLLLLMHAFFFDHLRGLSYLRLQFLNLRQDHSIE